MQAKKRRLQLSLAEQSGQHRYKGDTGERNAAFFLCLFQNTCSTAKSIRIYDIILRPAVLQNLLPRCGP